MYFGLLGFVHLRGADRFLPCAPFQLSKQCHASLAGSVACGMNCDTLTHMFYDDFFSAIIKCCRSSRKHVPASMGLQNRCFQHGDIFARNTKGEPVVGIYWPIHYKSLHFRVL